ncbi:oligosaccharide flippase family protein [Rhizobium leguminosarum]|uniref:lipopolysaccharide biosynthesis protein n=1 Tax=Rhizobium leguminosarum TaxID=384 RepID=UPI001C946FB9|nr:oligosaccharide flippase family protein [Rhizobium leguminosarum]MBY5544938.1 oligosaccharide flippase family protein [Rhizobium leguminosarum]
MSDERPESHGRRSNLLGNSGWNFAGFLFMLVANLATVPFVVRWIGLQTLGSAGIVIAIAAPVTLIGTVLGQAVVREISARIGRGEEHAAARIAIVGIKICLIASAVAWLGIVLAGPWIMTGIAGASLPSQNLTVSFLIVATGTMAQQFSFVLQGICVGKQSFRLVAQASAWSSFATIIMTLGCTWSFPVLNGYLLGFSGSLVLSTVGWIWITSSEFRESGRLISSSPDELKSLLHFGKWQSLSQLAGIFGNQIDRYVLASLAPSAVVGQYNVCNRVQEAAYIAVIRICEVLFPRFGNMSNSREEERHDFFMLASWGNSAFGAIVLSPIAVLSRPLLTVWVGEETAAGGTHLLQILILGGIVGCGSNVFQYYAMGMGRNAPAAYTSLAYSVMTVVFSFISIWCFGPYAAGAGLLVASLIRVPLALLVTRNCFFSTFSAEQMFACTVAPILVGICIVVGSLGLNFTWINGWLSLAFAYVCSVCVVSAAIAAVAMTTKTGSIILSRIYGSVRTALSERRLIGWNNHLVKRKRGF